MEKCYNEKEQATIIEVIFQNIILVKLDKEYQQATSYRDKNQQYQCKVFNNNDLMRKIFEYLTFEKGFIGQLYYCSLVNTCWLYHIWNTKLPYGRHTIDPFLNATWKLLHQIKQMKSNQYCASLPHPKVSIDWSDNSVKFHVINAKLTNLGSLV